MSEDSETGHLTGLDTLTAPRVLVVDDDELMLERLRVLISDAGLDVATAPDGLSALRQLESRFSPLIVLDRNMPGMDGLTVCRTIRERHWPGYVYILLLTLQDADEDSLTGLNAGADDYVSKRCSTAHLLARLRTAHRILALEQSLRAALEEKHRLSLTDTLTGLPNRRYFYPHLDRDLKRIQRAGGQLTLMSLDIDHFKRVNDQYGHAGGDEVLQEFVKRVSSCLRRGTDWCARVGGEEFAVVLCDTPPSAGCRVAETIREAVAAAPFRLHAGAVTVTVSIGVSGCEGGAHQVPMTLDLLLQQSDQHLYVSKASGRNCVYPSAGLLI